MLETNFANKCARDNNLYTKEYTIYLDSQVKSKLKSILKRRRKKSQILVRANYSLIT